MQIQQKCNYKVHVSNAKLFSKFFVFLFFVFFLQTDIEFSKDLANGVQQR